MKTKLGNAEAILTANGIPKDAAPDVLKAVGYALLGRDLYDPTPDDMQNICSALRDAICLTGNGGTGNHLAELIYIPEEEKVRPVFANGSGRNGYYDINVAGDSGTALITDVVNQFVRKMW